LIAALPLFCILLLHRPPTYTLFPYTTLFRSVQTCARCGTPEVAFRVRSWGLITRAHLCNVVVTYPAWREGKKYLPGVGGQVGKPDRKSTRLNSSHQIISYAVFCLKKKNNRRI